MGWFRRKSAEKKFDEGIRAARPGKFKKVSAGFGRSAFKGASMLVKKTGEYGGKGVSKSHKELRSYASRSYHKGHYNYCQVCGRYSGEYPLCKFHYNKHKLDRFGHFGKIRK